MAATRGSSPAQRGLAALAVAKLGRTIDKPAASTATFVTMLRELLAGRELTQSQLGYDFKQSKIQPMAPCPPIDVMAMRPGMINAQDHRPDRAHLDPRQVRRGAGWLRRDRC